MLRTELHSAPTCAVNSPLAWLLAQGDEERVFEGHGGIVADLCNELQPGVTRTTLTPVLS